MNLWYIHVRIWYLNMKFRKGQESLTNYWVSHIGFEYLVRDMFCLGCCLNVLIKIVLYFKQWPWANKLASALKPWWPPTILRALSTHWKIVLISKSNHMIFSWIYCHNSMYYTSLNPCIFKKNKYKKIPDKPDPIHPCNHMPLFINTWRSKFIWHKIY